MMFTMRSKLPSKNPTHKSCLYDNKGKNLRNYCVLRKDMNPNKYNYLYLDLSMFMYLYEK